MTAWQQSLIVRPEPENPCSFAAIDTVGETLHCVHYRGHASYHAGTNGERWTTMQVLARTPIERKKPVNHLTRTDPATGLRHGWIRYPNGNPPAPFGCRWCGTATDEHGGRGPIPGRPHHYAIPTPTQIQLRMIARRRARKATT
jgi:hypothetical protein